MSNVLCTDTQCYVSTDLLQETINNLLTGKNPVIPKFIITFGPPGSGKSTMVEHAIYNNNIDRNNTVNVNVDTVIESFQAYQDELREVRNLLAMKRLREARELAVNIYKKYRQTGATFSDLVLNHALLLRYNVIWETTGNSTKWSIPEIERVKRYGYKVILVYPFVETEQLVQRTELRGYASLRFLDPTFIEMVSKNAQQNFVELSRYVDEAYIYDNTVPNPDWTKSLLELTTVLDWKKGILKEYKCDQKRLKELLEKMDHELAAFIVDKCQIE